MYKKMNFKKRLLILCPTVIVIIPYCYVLISKDVALAIQGPPYVDGWYKNTSRNISNYVNEEMPPNIMPKMFCKEKKFLLVFINVRLENFKTRDVIRQTWGEKHSNVSFYFMVGFDRNFNYEQQLRLEEESLKYDDIIQENFLDSYNNLTIKCINMLKLFNLHCFDSYKFYMKIDEDVFLNLPNLLKFLENHQNENNFLYGKLINDTKPFRDPSSKWYVPYELYPEKKYPPYMCGPAYVMSADVAKKLYECAFETPIFHIEDVYITGICAKKMNVTPRHNDIFTCLPFNSKYACIHKNLATIHFHEPEDIQRSHYILKKNKCWAPGSVMEFIYSFWY